MSGLIHYHLLPRQTSERKKGKVVVGFYFVNSPTVFVFVCRWEWEIIYDPENNTWRRVYDEALPEKTDEKEEEDLMIKKKETKQKKVQLRRSSRLKKLPKRLKDFVLNM